MIAHAAVSSNCKFCVTSFPQSVRPPIYLNDYLLRVLNATVAEVLMQVILLTELRTIRLNCGCTEPFGESKYPYCSINREMCTKYVKVGLPFIVTRSNE